VSIVDELDTELKGREGNVGVLGLLLLGYSVVLAALVVTALHFLTTWGLGRSAVLQTILLAPVWLVAAALIVVLVRTYRRMRADPKDIDAQLLGFATSAVVIGVAAQAFAAMNVYLALRGAAGNGDPPSLWRTETSYIWHFLDAVPFVDVPSTLHWCEPHVFHDHMSGSLLLVFKLAVIVPFVGFWLAAYHALEREQERAKNPTGHGLRVFDIAEKIEVGAGGAAGVFILLLALVLGLYFGLPAVFDSTARLNRWLGGKIPDAVDFRGYHIPLSWVEVVPQAIGVVLLLYLAFIVVALLAFRLDFAPTRTTWWNRVGPLGAYVCLIVFLVELWSMLSLTLLHWGLATAHPPPATGDEVPATLGYYLWHALDLIPALDVPQTLNFRLPIRFVDSGSAALLLAFEIAILIVIGFPIMRRLRS
jgi:hypothetical protein